MSLEATPPSPQAEDVFGGWLEISKVIAQFVSGLPGLRGVSAVIDLLLNLCDVQNGQNSLLTSIKADTTAIREADFRLAMSSMKEARRVGPDDPSWETFIRRAEASLSRALGQAKNQQEAALIELNLGTVWLAIGHQGNGRYHFEESARHTTRIVDEYVKKAYPTLSDARPSRPRTWRMSREQAIIAGAIGAGAGLSLVTFGLAAPVTIAAFASSGVATAAAVRARQRQECERLKDFIGFYNLIQCTLGGMSGPAGPQYLTLERVVRADTSSAIENSMRNFVKSKPDYILRLR
jgi:hypothetical protein